MKLATTGIPLLSITLPGVSAEVMSINTIGEAAHFQETVEKLSPLIKRAISRGFQGYKTEGASSLLLTECTLSAYHRDEL